MSTLRIHELLTFAVKHKASDIHLSAGEVPGVRIDGEVRRLDLDPLGTDDARRLAYSVMNEKQKTRFENDHEVDFSICDFSVLSLADLEVQYLVPET